MDVAGGCVLRFRITSMSTELDYHSRVQILFLEWNKRLDRQFLTRLVQIGTFGCHNIDDLFVVDSGCLRRFVFLRWDLSSS